MLRWSSPIQIFGRNAAHDIELHGQHIPKGDIVALSFGAANRDPDVFADAERCVLDRTPNRHLAFGAGPHLCLGSPVAHLEMMVTLQTFAQCVGKFSLDAASDTGWKTRGDRRDMARLPVIIETA